MVRLVFAIAAAVIASLGPACADASAPQEGRPALWTVHSSRGTAYLFGSIHILPPQMNWRSKEVTAAIAASDVFVFEILLNSTSQLEAQDYVKQHGMLAPGQSLRAMLPVSKDAEYDSVVAQSGLSAAALDHMQPWLASIALTVASLKAQNFDVSLGPDIVLNAEVVAEKKPVLAFETIDQQLALMASGDLAANVGSLCATIDDIADQSKLVQDMLDAWMIGGTAKLETLINGNLDRYPGARRILLDDRNRRWVKQLSVLLRQRKTFFVTVGAGHLLGAMGVPALLRRAGYRVDGP